MKLAACLLVVAACQIEDDLVPCGDKLCPVGSVCLWSYDRCATPEQVNACRDVPTGLDCSTSDYENGGCFEGACLRRGCGNGFIELDEECDDGNERSLDGCSSDCKSTEVCGNLIRDPGEDCDDGGLVSKDGCDSRCLAEVGVWREVPLGLAMDPGLVADDEARQRLVAPGATSTWELIADAWHLAPGTQEYARAPYFDTVRGQIVALVSEAAPVANEARAKAWNGTSWIPISVPLVGLPGASTFDRGRGRPVIMAGGTLVTFDASGAWSDYPTQPTNEPDFLIYDPANDELVSLQGFTAAEEYFDPDSADDAWTARTRPFPGFHAVGLDGATVVVVVGTQLWRRGASGWTTNAAEDLPSQIPSTGAGLVYRRGGALVVEKGVSRCRRTGTTWSCTSNPSNTDYALVQDGDNHMRVVGGPYSWLVDDTLGPRQTVPSSPTGFRAERVVYSPALRKIIASGTTPPCAPCLTETRVLEATGWQLLHADDASLGPMLYNPDRRFVVQQRDVGGGEPYELLDEGLSPWVPASIPDGGGFEYLVWDARLHHYVGVQIAPFTTFVYDLATEAIDPAWQQDEVAPRGDLTSDERSGSIVAVPPQSQNLNRLWERRDGIWTPRSRLPYEVDFVSSAYESDTGRLWIMGWASPRLVAFVHEYTSPTPLETCTDPTADLDGDGIPADRDPDCYWMPDTLLCPPFVSCPVPI